MGSHSPALFVNHPWFGTCFILCIVGLTFLDWLEQRERLADLGVRGVSTLFAPSILWTAVFIGFLVYGVGWFFLFFLLIMLVSNAHPRPGPAARGELQQRIEDLGRKSGAQISDARTWSWDQTNVCIVHDTFRWWPATASTVKYVFVPLRFLNWFSRKEIDALVARQLRPRGSWRMSSVAFIATLLYSLTCALVLKLVHVNPLINGYVLPLLAVVEITAITLYWPRVSLQTHLAAIRLTGDPDSYISALAGLAHLNKTRVDDSLFMKIAQSRSGPSSRSQFLTGHQSRPAEDRYPIDENYFRSGR